MRCTESSVRASRLRLKARSSILNGLFFDPRRYDLSRVGRYKYNKKLNLAGRITGRQLSRPIVNPATGEVMAEAGTVVSRTLAEDIDNAGVTTAWVALLRTTRRRRLSPERHGRYRKIRFL